MVILGGLGGLLLIAIIVLAGLTLLAQKFKLHLNRKWSKILLFTTLFMVLLSAITHFVLYENNMVWTGTISNNIIYLITILAFMTTVIFVSPMYLKIGMRVMLNIVSVFLSIFLIYQISQVRSKTYDSVLYQNKDIWVEMKRFMGPPNYYLFTKNGLISRFEQIKFDNMDWPLEVEVKKTFKNKYKIYYKRFEEKDSMVLQLSDKMIRYINK